MYHLQTACCNTLSLLMLLMRFSISMCFYCAENSIADFVPYLLFISVLLLHLRSVLLLLYSTSFDKWHNNFYSYSKFYTSNRNKSEYWVQYTLEKAFLSYENLNHSNARIISWAKQKQKKNETKQTRNMCVCDTRHIDNSYFRVTD